MRLGARGSGRSRHRACRGPGRVVEARLVPAGDLAPRVVCLAEVVAVVAGRPGRADLPRGVGRHQELGPVRVRDVEVEPQPRRRAPLGLFPAPVPGSSRGVVLARAELRRNHVLTLPDERRHVLRRVEHGLAVVGEPGVEHAGGCGCAVERQLVVGQPRRVDPGARDGPRDLERPAQHRRRAQLATLALVVLDARRRETRGQPRGRPAQLTCRADDVVVGRPGRFGQRSVALRPGDPLALPLAGAHECRLEPRRRRPVARRSRGWPDTHGPVVAGARAQSRAGVDAPGIGRRRPPGVPDVGLPLACELRRRRHQDAVRRLHHAAPGAEQGPCEPRSRIVGAEGLGSSVRLQP